MVNPDFYRTSEPEVPLSFFNFVQVFFTNSVFCRVCNFRQLVGNYFFAHCFGERFYLLGFLPVLAAVLLLLYLPWYRAERHQRMLCARDQVIAWMALCINWVSFFSSFVPSKSAALTGIFYIWFYKGFTPEWWLSQDGRAMIEFEFLKWNDIFWLT